MARPTSPHDWGAIVVVLRRDYLEAMPQEDFARLIGVKSTIVSRWERGRAEPQYRNQQAIARVAVRKGFARELWPLKAQKMPRGLPSGKAGREPPAVVAAAPKAGA